MTGDFPQFAAPQPCPTCGTCPTCGRGPAPVAPAPIWINPWPGYQPPFYGPVWMGGTSAQGEVKNVVLC